MNSTEPQRKNGSAAADSKPGAPKDTTQTTIPPRRMELLFIILLLLNFWLGRLLMPGAEEPVKDMVMLAVFFAAGETHRGELLIDVRSKLLRPPRRVQLQGHVVQQITEVRIISDRSR